MYVGGDPRLIFLNEKGYEMKTVDLSKMNSQQIEMTLQEHGFYPSG